MRIGSSSGPTGDRPIRDTKSGPAPTGGLDAAHPGVARDGVRLSVARDFTSMDLPSWPDDFDPIELPTAREKIGGLPAIKDLLAKNSRSAEVTVRISRPLEQGQPVRPAPAPRALEPRPATPRGTAPLVEQAEGPRVTRPLPPLRLRPVPKLPST